MTTTAMNFRLLNCLAGELYINFDFEDDSVLKTA